jgi:hypothetical protein
MVFLFEREGLIHFADPRAPPIGRRAAATDAVVVEEVPGAGVIPVVCLNYRASERQPHEQFDLVPLRPGTS